MSGKEEKLFFNEKISKKFCIPISIFILITNIFETIIIAGKTFKIDVFISRAKNLLIFFVLPMHSYESIVFESIYLNKVFTIILYSEVIWIQNTVCSGWYVSLLSAHLKIIYSRQAKFIILKLQYMRILLEIIFAIQLIVCLQGHTK